MISTGVYFGGPEQKDSDLSKLFSAAERALREIRGQWVGSDDFSPSAPRPATGLYFEVGATPATNVVFYVPGSVIGYEDLKRIEAARFSRMQKLLLVAVPVPKEVVETGGSVEFIVDALHQANRIAAETFAKKGSEPFDVEKAESIVEKVRQALIEQGFS